VVPEGPRTRGPEEPVIDRIYELQRQHHAAAVPTTAAQRIEKLKKLERAMFAHRDDVRAAMWDDYRKPVAEVDLSEIYPVVSEARHAIRHLREWMRPTWAPTRLSLFGAQSRILREPKGVVLIISPWNFPFNLTFGPLVSAIAAGNRVVLKPSELTPASTACMTRIVGEVFDESEVAIIEGDASVAEALLKKKWDHIFFTGSPAVGKIVMKAAAEHLTSITLELGGKSPVIVDETANIDEAAKKVAFGKFYNCGQICIAPDYVLVHERVRGAFLAKLKTAIDSLGQPARGIIVNDRHASRLHRLFDDTVAQGAEVVTGGAFRGREIEPTVLANVAPESPVMQHEIFGPLLPILPYRSLDEACDFINAREKPLVMYVFSRNRRVVKRILGRTTAGATVMNQTLAQYYELSLPFGGVGQSGMGRAHGYYGFEAFSNVRALFDQRLRFGALQLLYPPYVGKFKQKLIDFTVRWL
jgi:aldehyde dehydrogenase (NAD+)